MVESTRCIVASAVLVFVVCVSTSFSRPGRADASNFTIVDHNIKGNGRTQNLNYLVSMGAASDAPLGFTLQEVCSDDYNGFLIPYFLAGGYSNYGFRTQEVGLPNCGSFGVAMFLKGTVVSTGSSYKYSHQWDNDPDSRGRGFRCITSTSFGLVYAECSTHLANGSGSLTGLQAVIDAQSTELHTFVNSFDSSVGVVVGGDFNRDPSPSGGWATDYVEADPTNQPTTSSHKYDYLWGRAIRFTVPQTANMSVGYQGSDHKNYRGYFNWK